jgi:sporulation protein YlmC with PRC-barrel domain
MPVYDARGKRIGKVERLMIDKLTGRIAYAILSFSSFLRRGSLSDSLVDVDLE